MVKWELHKVKRMAWIQDDSGIYTLISCMKVKATHKQYAGVYLQVRLDIMSCGTDCGCGKDEPIMSFQGLGNDVRMHTMKWLLDNCYYISSEHSSYIGYELCRAMSGTDYVQD